MPRAKKTTEDTNSKTIKTPSKTTTKSKIDLSKKSDMYKNIKRLWDTKVWKIDQIKNAVNKGYISKEDFKEITNKAFK